VVKTGEVPEVARFAGGPFGENGYVVSCPRTGKGILVDPGASVGEMLAAAKAKAIEIESIVLTHAHLDHVDGVARAKRETGAPVRLHPDDEPLYREAPAQAQWFGVDLETPPPVDEYLRHGEVLRVGGCSLEVRHTPGHAPGHVILVAHEDGFAVVGDVVFQGSIGRTDLPGGDFKTLMASIREQVLTLPDDTVLYPGHGPPTTVGAERAGNPFLIPHYGGGLA
jgi:hydroxyacylglutathione hydrolase